MGSIGGYPLSWRQINKTKGEKMRGKQMRSVSRELGIFVIGFFIFGCADVWGADWRYFSTAHEGMLYWYDAQGVTYEPNKVIHVWIRKVRPDEGRIKGEGKITASELEQLTSRTSYEQSLIEIDCTEKSFNVLQRLIYDSEGVLRSGESKPGGRKRIQKNSNAEKLYKAVCK